jgi:hypothetical protein
LPDLEASTQSHIHPPDSSSTPGRINPRLCPSESPANQILPFHSAHFFAGFCAGPACVNAFIHISDALAVIRAIGADRGTNATGFLVQIRAAYEELGAGLANFRAKQHQPQVIGCHVLASHFKTMG